jgi:hypothetical protein
MVHLFKCEFCIASAASKIAIRSFHPLDQRPGRLIHSGQSDVQNLSSVVVAILCAPNTNMMEVSLSSFGKLASKIAIQTFCPLDWRLARLIHSGQAGVQNVSSIPANLVSNLVALLRAPDADDGTFSILVWQASSFICFPPCGKLFCSLSFFCARSRLFL